MVARLARLLVTACEELVQRSEFVEDAQGRLAPEEELLRLAVLDGVDDDRSEAGRLDLDDLDTLVELGYGLESENVVELLALVRLHSERQPAGHHNFVLPRNQETEGFAAAPLSRAHGLHELVPDWRQAAAGGAQSELANIIGAPNKNFACFCHHRGVVGAD